MSDLNLSLAYKLLSKCQEINKNGNVVISPLSVTLGLIAMAYGSKGNSKKQIGEVFGLETEITDQALHLVATEILSGLNEGLKIANALFADDTFSVSEDYYQNLKQGSLPLESKCVDFKTKSQDAVEEINKWVDDATDSKIKDFLQRDAVNSNTKMILVNAIHFKGKWAECFNEGSTVEKPFHKTPSESQVAKMMYLESNFYMTDCPELDCRCVELPYIQNSISCYILLPNKIDGLGYIHDNLNSDIFKSILQRIEEYKPKLALSLPKFKVGSEVDLKIVLNKLGIIDIFQAGRADLSGFSSEAKTDLYISAAIHKSIIEINEEGTEAAAATAFVISYCAYFPPEDFIVDRPFMIIIKNKKSNLVLFIGSIKDVSG